jgi:general stress protein 26
MGTPEHKQKIWNLISDIGTGMLVTENDGQLRARPMQLVQEGYDGKLWFFTKAVSPKTEEIQDHHQVCVSFSCPKDHVYVSLSGKAKLTWNKDLKDRYWSSAVSSWFPEGKDDPSCALLEIDVEHGEHWDSDESILTYYYEMTKSKIFNKKPNLGENQKF